MQTGRMMSLDVHTQHQYLIPYCDKLYWATLPTSECPEHSQQGCELPVFGYPSQYPADTRQPFRGIFGVAIQKV